MPSIAARHRPALLVGLVVALLGGGALGLTSVGTSSTHGATAEMFVGSSTDPEATFGIDGNDPTGLYPGGVFDLALTIDNDTGRTIDIHVADASDGCRAENLDAASFAGHHYVARGGTSVVHVDIMLKSDASNACMNATFPLEFSGTAMAWPGTEIEVVLAGDIDHNVCHHTFENTSGTPQPGGQEGYHLRLDDPCKPSDTARVIVRQGGPPAGPAQLTGVCIDSSDGRITVTNPLANCKIKQATFHDLLSAPLRACVHIATGKLRTDVKKPCDTGVSS